MRRLTTSPHPHSSVPPPPSSHSQTSTRPSSTAIASLLISRLASATILLGAGYALAVAFPPIEFLPKLLFFRTRPPSGPTVPSPSPSPPDPTPLPIPRLPAILDETSSTAYTDALEKSLHSQALVRQLRRTFPKVSRPYLAFRPDQRPNSFLGTTLRRPGSLALNPLVFSSNDDSHSVSIIHVGPSLCGHDRVIHGGLLASLLDEALARPAILNLPSTIGVTATLSIDYVKPTRADQFVVIRTELVRKEGRKAWVEGTLEDLQGQTLVKATALFVEPRNAWVLWRHARERVRRVFGVEELTGAGEDAKSK